MLVHQIGVRADEDGSVSALYLHINTCVLACSPSVRGLCFLPDNIALLSLENFNNNTLSRPLLSFRPLSQLI